MEHRSAQALRELPLAECMAAIIDYRGKTPTKTDFGVPLVTAKVIKAGRIEPPYEFIAAEDYDAWMRRGLPKTGDVVMTTEAPLGEVAQLDGTKVALAQRVITLRGKPGFLDNTFLKFMMQSGFVQDQLKARASGTTVLGIKQSELRRITLRIPPFDTQCAIAHILGTLDDKIELNRRMNETLEAMARALFKSWFVDFDPVRAKAEGRTPAGMDAETAKLFPSEFVESELGEIPKGWTCAPLDHWASALSGSTPSRSNASLWDGDLPWISPKVMTAIHADEADAFVTRNAVGNGTRIAPAGSTLIMVRGMGLHKEVRVSQARDDVTFNQDVKALVPRHIDGSLLLFAMLNAQEYLLGRVESSGHGTGKLPSEILLSNTIVMPPIEVQTPLSNVFASMNNRIGVARSESRRLAALRDTLLPRLLSGELTPRDAQRSVAEAQ